MKQIEHTQSKRRTTDVRIEPHPSLDASKDFRIGTLANLQLPKLQVRIASALYLQGRARQAIAAKRGDIGDRARREAHRELVLI